MRLKLEKLVHENKKNVPVDNHIDRNYQVPVREHILDIRGEKPDEAEFEVIKFIDDSYVASRDRIEILHGKGTGALKNIVKIILKKHDKVKNFYFAPIEAGGEGITIVELL